MQPQPCIGNSGIPGDGIVHNSEQRSIFRDFAHLLACNRNGIRICRVKDQGSDPLLEHIKQVLSVVATADDLDVYFAR